MGMVHMDGPWTGKIGASGIWYCYVSFLLKLQSVTHQIVKLRGNPDNIHTELCSPLSYAAEIWVWDQLKPFPEELYTKSLRY